MFTDMNWMKKVAVALVCLLPLGLQAAKVDTLQVKSPSMNKSIEVVVVSGCGCDESVSGDLFVTWLWR